MSPRLRQSIPRIIALGAFVIVVVTTYSIALSNVTQSGKKTVVTASQERLETTEDAIRQWASGRERRYRGLHGNRVMQLARGVQVDIRGSKLLPNSDPTLLFLGGTTVKSTATKSDDPGGGTLTLCAGGSDEISCLQRKNGKTTYGRGRTTAAALEPMFTSWELASKSQSALPGS